MPGLIDSHVHVTLERSEFPLPRSRAADLDDRARRAADARHAQSRLHDRARYRRRRLGPRRPRSSRAIFRGRACSSPARAIGPTGGHSDPRRRTDFGMRCHCCDAMRFGMRPVGRRVGGAASAMREQMRQGADHIKIMMSGGVASPYDPLDSLQFRPAEVAAAVRGGARLRPLCLRPRLYAGSDHARRAWRRARRSSTAI